MKLTHASGRVLVSDQAPALAPRKHISMGVNLKKSKIECIKLGATRAGVREFARGLAVLRPPSQSPAGRTPPVRSPVRPLSRVPESRRRS
jgi:hypothetical protein